MPAKSYSNSSLPLAGCQVVVTRPRLRAESLARALRRQGACVLRLPAQMVTPNPAFDWSEARSQCTVVDGWIFTSPAAVAAALPLYGDAGFRPPVFAVGSTTAAALQRRGVAALAPPGRQDSEGVLELPALADVAGRHFVVVGAIGGRGLLAATLQQRGARVDLWPVYRREVPAWSSARLQTITAALPPLRVLISSTESLQNLAGRLPAAVWGRLRAATWVASSERLGQALSAVGVAKFTIAASAGSGDLVAATIRSLKR